MTPLSASLPLCFRVPSMSFPQSAYPASANLHAPLSAGARAGGHPRHNLSSFLMLSLPAPAKAGVEARGRATSPLHPAARLSFLILSLSKDKLRMRLLWILSLPSAPRPRCVRPLSTKRPSRFRTPAPPSPQVPAQAGTQSSTLSSFLIQRVLRQAQDEVEGLA